MADYEPPTENLPEFNPAVFRTNDVPLTITEAERLFLRFPTAQGTETLQSAVIAGKLSTTNGDTKSLVYGYQTTENGGSGLHNTAFGYQAGKGFSTLTTGGGNTAFGAITMPSITTSATNNTAIGHNALYSLSSGLNNTVVGTQSQANQLITTGVSNTLIGYNTYVIDDTGVPGNTSRATAVGVNAYACENSTAIGRGAGAKIQNSVALGNTATANNSGSIAIGSLSTSSADNSISIGPTSNTTGVRGIAIGFGANAPANAVAIGNTTVGPSSVSIGDGIVGSGEYSVIVGSLGRSIADNVVVIGTNAKGGSAGDVCIGASAGRNLNGAIRTIAIGNGAIGFSGKSLTGGNDNTCIGLNSGRLLSGDGGGGGSCAENVALGNSTLGGGLATTENTTGYANTCIGFQCGRNITSANYNTGIGWKSLGGSELAGVFTGTDNQCFGIQAGARLTTGSGNSFLGSNAGGLTTTGEKNVCIGVLSMTDATGTSENTFIGYRAGKALGTGNRNSALGAETVITNGITEATAIGYGATAPASQTITLGRVNTDSVRLNMITPMYSSLPSLTLANIGGTSITTNGITYSPLQTTIFTQSSLPIGVYSIYFTMLVIVTTPAYLSLKLGATQFYGPIYYTLHSSPNTYLYNVSTVFNNSAVQNLTLVTNSTSTGYSSTVTSDLRIVRIA